MLVKPDLNKPVFSIYPEKKEAIVNGLCPLCFLEIREMDFDSNINVKEYSISGLCQRCQDTIFDKK